MDTPAPLSSRPTSSRPTSSERTVLLDADVDRVLAALDSPDLLSAWLGDWTPDTAGDGATVVTDDGVERRVTHLDAEPTVRRWRWSPTDEPSSWSDVVLTVTVEGDRTRLTVTETLPAHTVTASASTALAVRWLPSLIALGAVLAVGSLVAV